ncbi:MAG: extracellular solute-binding protein [Firmicutes bacterium]|nr:extracellular solute-binding protein [Bacillota bacterium]
MNYGIAPIPVKAGNPPVNLGVADYIMAFKQTKHPEAVAKFLTFIYEPDNYYKFCHAEGMLPGTKEVAARLSKADPTLAQFIDMLPTARFFPSIDPQWPNAYMAAIHAAQAAILGQKPLKTALDEAIKSIK